MDELTSRFPTGTSEEDIFEMFLLCKAKAVCCECSLVNTIEIDPEHDTFKCIKCGTEQLLPFLNPDELSERA